MNRFLNAIVFFSIMGLSFVSNAGMTESQYLANAKKFIDKGELKAASIELKNVLQKNPKHPLARLELGKLHLKIGDMVSAEKELSRAQSLGVEDEQLLPYLARSLLYQGKHAEVMALSLKDLRDKSKSEVLAQKGLSLLAQGDTTKAKSVIDLAMGTGEVSVRAMFANAQFLGFTKEFEQSRKQLDAVSKVDPSFAPAWSLLGDIELREGNNKAALNAFTKAVSLRANNMGDMLKRVMILIQIREYDKAQKDITYLKDRIPTHPGFNYAQGLIHFYNKNLHDAQSAFDLALVDEQRYPLALYYAGVTNYLLGQRKRAEEYAIQYFTKFPGFPPVRKLMALIQLSKFKYKKAEELIRPLVEANNSDASAMNILATALLKQGKTDESIDLLSKVVELNPDSPQAQMRLGVGLMISGDDSTGEDHLSIAANLDKSNKRGRIVLILNYLRQKQFDRAREAAKEYKNLFPDEAMSYSVLGRVYMLTGKKQEAQIAYTNALRVEPGNPSASLSMAALAIGDKEFSKARDYYLTALDKHNNHLAILLKLAALDSMENNEESMIGYLQQAKDAHPKALGPRLFLARYYISKGKGEQVATLVDDLDKTQRESPPAWELVSLAQLAKGDFLGAQRTLERSVEHQPKSAKVHHWLAQAYAGLGKAKEMRTELEKSVELMPEYLAARIALAQYLLRSGEMGLVAEHMAIFKKLAPEHPEVLKLEKAAALTVGNTERALELADAAYDKDPSTSNMLTLSKIKWNLGDQDGAMRLLMKWLQEHPGDVNARLTLAGNYIIQENVDACIEQYQSVLDIDDDNLIALNNLAWFLRKKDPTKALQYARIAVDLQPKSPALLDTLAMVLLENNETAEARRIIKGVLVKVPENPTIQYHGAMIFAATGAKEEAIRLLGRLAGGEANYPEKKDAQVLLIKLQAEK